MTKLCVECFYLSVLTAPYTLSAHGDMGLFAVNLVTVLYILGIVIFNELTYFKI